MNIFEEYLNYDLSVIPCRDKMPLITWKPYQTFKASNEIAKLWQGDIACICGNVSQGLVCIDFDVKNGDKYTEWMEIIKNEDPDLFWKLVIESTPSGGFHVVFRSDVEIKNVKLAMNKENKATIETRGEGGYFVSAPSKNYNLLQGSYSKIYKVTTEEHDYLISLCKSLNEYKQENKPIISTAIQTGLSPFDDYDSKVSPTGLLVEHGWTVLFCRGNADYLQRPGKTGRGISATWNHIPNRLYVFTSSTDFKNEEVYKASAVYTMLYHKGDYNAAAKKLYSEGYGDRIINNPVKSVTHEAVIINPIGRKEEMMDMHRNGLQSGLSTGWKCLDKLYSVLKGQFTVITGYPSSGKSEFMDALAMNLALKSNWKFAVFSPENYPVKLHLRKLSEKYIGKCFNGINRMSELELDKAIDYINEHFFFIDALEDDISITAIMNQAKILVEKYKIDGLILDPWNEIELSKPKDISETEFIGTSLRDLRKFARKYNIHLWIVAHPCKPMKNKDGSYPVPELYDIQGSSHWRNKADNGICIDRNFKNNTTNIHTQKIKFRYTGEQGTCVLKYNLTNGRYEEIKPENIYGM